MKLQSLKSSLQVAKGRLGTLQDARSGTVERKRGTTGVNDRNRIRERDCGLCQACRRNGKTSVGREVDHIVPLWAGGSDEDANKELLCEPHHREKTAREAAERGAGGWSCG